MAEKANTRSKGQIDGTRKLQKMELDEEEVQKTKWVKCKVCNNKETWERYVILMGCVPKFCKCKPGEEDIVIVWV